MPKNMNLTAKIKEIEALAESTNNEALIKSVIEMREALQSIRFTLFVEEIKEGMDAYERYCSGDGS